jgi:hypothetical protein
MKSAVSCLSRGKEEETRRRTLRAVKGQSWVEAGDPRYRLKRADAGWVRASDSAESS